MLIEALLMSSLREVDLLNALSIAPNWILLNQAIPTISGAPVAGTSRPAALPPIFTIHKPLPIIPMTWKQ
jgi:hypothetical protein